MRFPEARKLLEACCAAGGLPKPSSNTKAEREQRSDASRLEWWLVGPEEIDAGRTNRTKAYLKAYQQIASPRPIFARSIPVGNQFMWPDRKVMRFALNNKYVEFMEKPASYFILTEKGNELISK